MDDGLRGLRARIVHDRGALPVAGSGHRSHALDHDLRLPAPPEEPAHGRRRERDQRRQRGAEAPAKTVYTPDELMETGMLTDQEVITVLRNFGTQGDLNLDLASIVGA